MQLRQNILDTPLVLRQLIKHPILDQEDFSPSPVQLQEIDFTGCKMNEFSLKYLAKFITRHKVENLAVHGSLMPLNTIKLGLL